MVKGNTGQWDLRTCIWIKNLIYLWCILIFKNLLPSSVHTKCLEAVTNSVARSTPSPQIVVSKYHFQEKEPDNLGEMADSRSGAVNSQFKPGTFSHTRKQRSSPHSLGSCQQIIGAKLKGLLLAKDETVLCIKKFNNYNRLKHIKYMYFLIYEVTMICFLKNLIGPIRKLLGHQPLILKFDKGGGIKH